jgi:hypothetical protein
VGDVVGRCRGSGGQQDSRLVGIAPVVQRDVADPLDDFRSGRSRKFRQYRVASVAVADPRAHLDEFVIAKRPVQFRDQVWRNAALTDQDDGIAVVAQPAEVLALRFGEGSRLAGAQVSSLPPDHDPIACS